MIKAGIVGGSGYTGGELLRILINHPEVEIDFVYSRSLGGKKVADTHPDLLGVLEKRFTDTPSLDVDVLFLCLGHGNSKAFLKENDFDTDTRIIDLSNDFRLPGNSQVGQRDFVYGLPELRRDKICDARNIANPGCFATAIQLALLPLAGQGLLSSDVHVNAITGSTGAGQSGSATTHFSWRNNNVSWYKPFTHQHLPEIETGIASLQPDAAKLYFLPYRGNFTRGIHAAAYTRCELSGARVTEIYEAYYANAVFTHLSGEPLHLKQVINTNQCHIHLHRHEDLILVTSVIDNLLKGASGQAVQNMNLMFGLDEGMGLHLKAGLY